MGVAFSPVWCILTPGPAGEQQQPVRCFRADVGVVDEDLCDLNSRPDDRHRHCKNMDCPARSERDAFLSEQHDVLCRPEPEAGMCNYQVVGGRMAVVFRLLRF